MVATRRSSQVQAIAANWPILCIIRTCRISERKIRKPTTPALAVVRECRVCLFMATTTASYAAVVSMISVKVRCAKRSEENGDESDIAGSISGRF